MFYSQAFFLIFRGGKQPLERTYGYPAVANCQDQWCRAGSRKAERRGWGRGPASVPLRFSTSEYATCHNLKDHDDRTDMACYPILILLIAELVDGLRLIEVRIDKHTVLGNSTLLECRFDLQGENLYSVKWYKDGHEFYRYVPRDIPPAQIFELPGVYVRLDKSNESEVRLENLTLRSSGKYRCEVSGEAPNFQTVSDHGDMITVALPEKGPTIDGGRPRYQVGEMVDLNCTSGPSKPPAQLIWYINGAQANGTLLRGPRTRVVKGGLEETTLGLEFRVERKHFRRGHLKLKCLASIATIYWNSNEESVEGDRQQRPPALEVKDNLPHSSRTDRVLVSTITGGVSTALLSVMTLFLSLNSVFFLS
ncbi:uncharacterized protein LOC106670091 [Cimex lectularius]|uniref:Ig-like domain-containing protein n=1 Tax=Cimex lectularius TaxID=79782 RepID=A0A8I6TGF8_CIMLE|nr:uncharacterized protein LOC106670091 [Cimex lectularius]